MIWSARTRTSGFDPLAFTVSVNRILLTRRMLNLSPMPLDEHRWAADGAGPVDRPYPTTRSVALGGT